MYFESVIAQTGSESETVESSPVFGWIRPDEKATLWDENLLYVPDDPYMTLTHPILTLQHFNTFAHPCNVQLQGHDGAIPHKGSNLLIIR